MRKFSVFLSLLLCFLLCLTANAVEASEETTAVPEETTEAPEKRCLGDADGDGQVSSADARLILRKAVEIEVIEGINLIYCDVDMNGIIGASDARLTLRVSVALEEKQEYAFEITDSKEASCTEAGYIKAKCVLTQTVTEMEIKQNSHKLTPEDYCKGSGVCSLCQQTVTVEIKHGYVENSCEGYRECAYCKARETFTPEHKFLNCKCKSCGLDLKRSLGEYMKTYLIENGTREDDFYYIAEYSDVLGFATVYDESVGFAYAYCGFAVDQNGVIIYYDFNFDFEENTVEAVIYTDEMNVAYAYGTITPNLVDENADGDAVILSVYESVPDLYGYEGMLRQMMEGAVNDTVKWLKTFAASKGFRYAGYAFADFIRVR